MEQQCHYSKTVHIFIFNYFLNEALYLRYFASLNVFSSFLFLNLFTLNAKKPVYLLPMLTYLITIHKHEQTKYH